MVLRKLAVPGRPTNLDNSRARATALAVCPGGNCLNIFLLSIISFFYLPVSVRRSDID